MGTPGLSAAVLLLWGAPCFLLHVSLQLPGLDGAVWVAQEEPEGENGSTHLESHGGLIRKLTPIWVGRRVLFPAFPWLH